MTSEKMNWIYDGLSGLIDKEEYLTGRRIDKTFEIAQLEKEGNLGNFDQSVNRIPSLLESTGKLNKSNLEATLKEDPLQEIKRKQADIIKEILNNPIKMKRIKHLLEESLRKEKEEKRARKRAKKHKKEKKSKAKSVESVQSSNKIKLYKSSSKLVKQKLKRESYSSDGFNDSIDKKERRERSSSELSENKNRDYRISSRKVTNKYAKNKGVYRERSSYRNDRHRNSDDLSESECKKRHRRSESAYLSPSRDVLRKKKLSSSPSSVSSYLNSSIDSTPEKKFIKNPKNRPKHSISSESEYKLRSKSEKKSSDYSTKDRYSKDYFEASEKYSNQKSSSDKPKQHKMFGEDWIDSNYKMVPETNYTKYDLQKIKNLSRERQQSKKRREDFRKSENSADDLILKKKYNDNFDNSSLKNTSHDNDSSHRNSKRKLNYDSVSSRKKRHYDYDERELEAKRKMMIKNGIWRESQRAIDVEMYVKTNMKEDQEVQENLNRIHKVGIF